MARRVNTKFLTILLIILVVIVGGVFAATQLIHKHPDIYIAAGKTAMKDGHWPEAAQNFAMAVKLSPKDLSLQILLGQAFQKMGQTNPDPSIWRLEGKAYESALEVNPDYMPALQAAIDWNEQMALRFSDDQSKASFFNAAIRYARHSRDLQPDDPKIAARSDILQIKEWLAGLTVDQSVVDASMQHLQDLWAKDQSNADLPFLIAGAKMELARKAQQKADTADQTPEVTGLYNDAIKIFESVLTGKDGGSQDHNSEMHFQFARLLQAMSVRDRSSPDNLANYSQRATLEITRARALAKEGDPKYLDINDFAAQIALNHGDIDAAVHIYRSMPQIPAVRMALAEVLSKRTETRPEGEDILRHVIGSLTDDPNHIIPGGYRYTAMLNLTNMHVLDFVAATSPDQKKKLASDIRDSLSKLNAASGTSNPLPLRIVEARFMVNSDTVQQVAAIQSLSKLMVDSPDFAKNYYIQSFLGQAYLQTNQSGKALPIYQNLVTEFPTDVQAKKKLVSILIKDDHENAGPVLADLDRMTPTDPEVVLDHIWLLMFDPEKNQAEVLKYYDKLSETTPLAMSAKALVASKMRNHDEVIRLLNARINQDKASVVPNDYYMLARAYAFKGSKDLALDAATRGTAAFPADDHLRLLVPQIKGESAEVLQGMEEEIIRKNPDKVQSELGLAIMAGRRGDNEGQETHLKAAEKLAPDDSRLWEPLFDLYLRTGRLAEAEQYVPKLAGINADATGGDLFRLALAEARGEMSTAETIARKLTQDKPEFARSWLALGDVLYNEHQYDDAISQYQQCIQRQPDVVPAYVGMAKSFYGLNRPADALMMIKQGITKNPGDATLQGLELTHKLNYGNPADAVAELQDKIHANPQPQLYAALGDVLLRYAVIQQANNQPNDALATAGQAVSVLNVALQNPAWADEAELYIALEESLLACKKPEDALKTLEQWRDRPAWKNQPDPYIRLSDFYERFGQPSLAEDLLHTALAKSGYSVELQLAMANLLTRHHKVDDALGLLRATNSDKAAVKERIVQILLLAGRFNDAESEFKTDLAGHPADAGTLLTMWAQALLQNGKINDCIDKATQALALNDSDFNALFCRGKAYLYTDPPDPRSALKDLVPARESNPKNTEIRLYMAEAYLALNQFDEASNELEAGLRFDPSNKAVRLKLVELYTTGARPKLNDALKLLVDAESIPPLGTDPDIYRNEAVLLQRKHDLPGALAKSEKALSLQPHDPGIVRVNLQLLLDSSNYQGVMDHIAAMGDDLKNKSWVIWARAQAEKHSDDPAAADDYRKALLAALDEKDPAGVDHIADDLSKQYGADKAIEQLTPLAKDHLAAKLSLAHTYRFKGDNASAVATMDSIINGVDGLSPNDQVDALASAALLYQIATPPLPDKALDAYQRWIKLQPDNIEALNNLACLLGDNFNPPRAKEGLAYAQRAVDLMHNIGHTEPRFLDTEAWLMILNGQPEDGVDILNKAIAEYKPFPDEYLHLAEGLLRMNYAADAETDAKRGLELFDKLVNADQDPTIRAKFEDVISRSEKLIAKNTQATVP